MPNNPPLVTDLAAVPPRPYPGTGFIWDTVFLGGAGQTWTQVCYGKGIFVTVSSGAGAFQVYTSTDGYTWTGRNAAAALQWMGVCYGNGLFVAIAQNGVGNQVMTSPDGINWTSRAEAVTRQWQSVVYGNGLFVAIANDGAGDQVMTSPDGVLWTTQVEAATLAWRRICWGNGVFVAIANDGVGNQVMTSPNGVAWTSRVEAVNAVWDDITYYNGYFVSVTATAQQYSTDGFAWVDMTSLWLAPSSVVGYGRHFYGAQTLGGAIAFTSFHPLLPVTGMGLVIESVSGVNSIACGNGILVAVGDTDICVVS